MDPAEELADLQNRFHLLEGDRKAFYEQSQLTLKQNKEVSDVLRRENKDLRSALSAIHKERGGGQETSALHESELNKVEAQLTLLRQRQNQLVCANKQKETGLAKQEDELRDLQRSSRQATVGQSNPMMRQIRTLENRLDKAMIKYNEAQSIRKTYDQIVKRLKEERVNFDNQLGAIEATLHAKEHDYEELLLMSHDASHAKDVAKAELNKLSALVDDEHNARAKELSERRSAVHARQEMNDRMEEREKARRDIVLEAHGDLSEQAEQALKKNVVTNALHHQLNANVADNEAQVMSAYESAFRKIKESTGVSDVNEVIQKFLTQEQTHDNLVNMTKEAQARIEALSEERVSTKTAVDEMKYSGGSGQGSRQEVETWERKHAEAQAALERVKTRYLRMTKVFIDIRVGIEHMADKLEPVKLDVPPVPVSDETIVDVMLQCDAKLMKMADAAPLMPADADRPITADTGAQEGAFNVRVNVAAGDDDEVDDDEEDEGLEPEIPDRQAMKKAHGQMLDKNAKGKKKRRKFSSAEKAGAQGGKSPAAGARSRGREPDLA